MELLTAYVIGITTIISLTLILLIIKNLRKKNIKVVTRNVGVAMPILNLTPPIHTTIPTIKTPDRILYENFIKKYDDGNLKFNKVPYRPGASMTCGFGAAEGYRYLIVGTDRLWDESQPVDKKTMVWGYVRPHMGVDRAAAKPYTMKNGTIVKDPVLCPFDFQRSQIVDFGNYSYGSLVTLFNDDCQFEFSIAHMDPKKDFIPWSLDRLKSRGSFTQGLVLGSAGNYGYSSGAHTHTEIKSYDESCEVFDILLEELYGDASLKEYTLKEIITIYRAQDKFKNVSDKVILQDWDSWKKNKKIMFSNQYKFVKLDIDGKSIKTWYSSYHLFNKL